MDIRMPKMDGLTMLGKLREEQIPCRAVVLTAYSEFDYAKQAIDHGVENYLLKPIKIPELKQVLQKTADEIRRVESQEKVLSTGGPGCGDVGTSGTKCGWIPDVPAEK